MSEIWSEMHIDLHVKYPLFCQIIMKLEFSPQIFAKYSSIKFHNNPSSGSRAVPLGHRDMTVAFRNFGNAPKKTLNLRIKTRSSYKTTNKKHTAANNNNVSWNPWFPSRCQSLWLKSSHPAHQHGCITGCRATSNQMNHIKQTYKRDAYYNTSVWLVHTSCMHCQVGR
jgi:hypothetical protein